MQPDIAIVPPPPPPPSMAHVVFFNERGLRAGWRILIYCAILVMIAMVVFGAYSLLIRGLPGTKTADRSPLSMAVTEALQFICVAVATFIMSRIERRPAGTYGLPLRPSACSRFISGYVLWGFLPLTLVLLIMRGLGVFYFGKPGLSPPAALGWALLWGFAFLMVGFLEEYLFRGYSLFTLADGIGFWPAAVILALIFGWAHMGNGGESYIGITGTILYALFATATLWRTGSLWLAVGAHAGWDWGQSFFYGVSDSGLQTPGHLFNPPPPQGPVWLSGGTVGPEGSIVVLIVWALMTVGFLAFWPNARAVNTISAAEEI